MADLDAIRAAHIARMNADVANFTDTLSDMAKRWKKEILSLLPKISTDPNATSRLRELTYMQTQVQAQLDRLGYTKLASKFINTSLPTVQQEVLQMISASGRPASLAPLNQTALATLRTLDYNRLTKVGEDTIHEISSGVIRSAIEGEPKHVIVEKIAGTLGKFKNYAGTIADTALRSYDRRVTSNLWEWAGIKHFRYDGPKDVKTRPFCLKIVGKTFTLAEYKAMNNGTKYMPVKIFGGGPNCRHSLTPDVTKG